jgi:hypothetical protein
MMMSHNKLTIIAIALLGINLAGHAAAKKDDPKQQEEALRQEAKTLINDVGPNSARQPVTGQFQMLPDEVANDKPFPKVIGVIAKDGAAVPVMAVQKSMIDQLTRYDRKDVTLMGKYLDKGDKGKWLIVDEVIVPSTGGPVVRRKRGGL